MLLFRCSKNYAHITVTTSAKNNKHKAQNPFLSIASNNSSIRPYRHHQQSHRDYCQQQQNKHLCQRAAILWGTNQIRTITTLATRKCFDKQDRIQSNSKIRHGTTSSSVDNDLDLDLKEYLDDLYSKTVAVNDEDNSITDNDEDKNAFVLEIIKLLKPVYGSNIKLGMIWW